jgi:hypothetical protein
MLILDRRCAFCKTYGGPRSGFYFRLVDMDITTDLLEAFLKCPTKCYLRAHEEVETGNPYADWVRTQSVAFRGEAIKGLMGGFAPDKCVTGTPAVESARSTQWQLATEFVARSENLQCSCHAVERSPSVGQGRVAQLIPIRFVFANKLTRDDKLLLAWDALVISKLHNREITVGRIVYGDDHATLNVKTSALKSEAKKLVDKIGPLISSPSPPRPGPEPTLFGVRLSDTLPPKGHRQR